MEGPKKRFLALLEGERHSETEAEGPAADPARAAGSREVISRKELARELRRQAYQRAKLARASDPRHLALKERAKLQRRELYRKAKEQRKAREAALDAKHGAQREAAHAEAKRQLAERVRGAVGKTSEPGRALARDIEHALQSAGVRELMDRLRLESAALAAQHQQEARAAHLEEDADLNQER